MAKKWKGFWGHLGDCCVACELREGLLHVW